MAPTKTGEKAQDSTLTEVWIGLGFLGLVVVGILGVFGGELRGLFSDAPPPAAVTSKAATPGGSSASDKGAATKGAAPSAPAPSK